MTKFNHVMVDIETTGTNGTHNAMIQLAAVRFDLDEREIDMNMFDECLMIPGNRFWAEDTREWWAGQDQAIIDKIWSRMRDPKTVLQEFYQWVNHDMQGENLVLWAKPSHFEYPFLESYFREYGIAQPFFYRNVNDLNSWCRARGLPNLSSEIEVQGNAHDAIHDVLHQIQVLFELMERTNVEAA